VAELRADEDAFVAVDTDEITMDAAMCRCLADSLFVVSTKFFTNH
jgi:hypothetical protein